MRYRSCNCSLIIFSAWTLFLIVNYKNNTPCVTQCIFHYRLEGIGALNGCVWMPGAGVCAIAAADPGLRDGRGLPGILAVVILLQVLDGEFLSCQSCWVWFARYHPGL